MGLCASHTTKQNKRKQDERVGEGAAERAAAELMSRAAGLQLIKSEAAVGVSLEPDHSFVQRRSSSCQVCSSLVLGALGISPYPCSTFKTSFPRVPAPVWTQTRLPPPNERPRVRERPSAASDLSEVIDPSSAARPQLLV